MIGEMQELRLSGFTLSETYDELKLLISLQ